MIHIEEYDSLLTAQGVALADLGLNKIALRRLDALRAVEILRRFKVVILGGDVFYEQAGQMKSAYANWHVDLVSSESQSVYAERSWNTATNYIKGFPNKAGVDPLFAIVVKKAV